MQDVFTFTGLICALLVCAAMLMFALAAFRSSQAADYYCSLREQIAETVADIGRCYEGHEPISARSVIFMLRKLNAREWPDVQLVKDNDGQYLTPPNAEVTGA